MTIESHSFQFFLELTKKKKNEWTKYDSFKQISDL